MPVTALPPSQTLVNLVGALGGKWHAYTAMCRCPAHHDVTPSLSLRQGDRGILVTCFAGCDPTDVLRALAAIRPEHRYEPPSREPVQGTANIERLWSQAAPVARTLAARYLDRRALRDDLNDLRYLSRCPFGARPATIFQPALLVAVRELRRLVAVQRIFLDRASAHYIRKAMLGTPGQGAWQSRAPDTSLAIAEGFETAAAFDTLHDTPCWAALGARRLDQLRLPTSINELAIAHDNDIEGRRAADKAAARYARPGLRIRLAGPPARYKDWSQVLEAAA